MCRKLSGRFQPHDFLYAAIVVSTDGYAFTIKNSRDELDHYTVDDQARKAKPGIPLLLLNPDRRPDRTT